MQVEVGDRLVLHGKHGTRIGVVVAGEEGGGSRVRWVDGGESVLSAGSEGSEEQGHATWEAAKAAPVVTWRRGITAGVGHEASVAQAKLTEKAVAEAPTTTEVAVVEEQPPEAHTPAVSE